MGILRTVYAWVAAKLWVSDLDIQCEHQPFGPCPECVAADTADKFR